jgi:hypothetical protein
MDGLIKDLKNIVGRSDDSDDHILMNSRYAPIKIEQKNFHRIHDDPIDPEKKILFVDGGNSILFESADFCIGIIRVGGIIYKKNRRVRRDNDEFYILIREDAGKYLVRTYPVTSFDKVVFNPDDEMLRNGLEKCDVGKIVSIIRRFAELEYASDSSKEVDYILLDGTLEARYPFEEKYLEKIFQTGKTCALSKTCSLTTKNGFGMTKKLFDMGRNTDYGIWYYHPIVVNNNPKHKAEMYFIRLNCKSDYVFRFEIQKGFTKDAEGFFSILARNSTDPIFLGYPYGLIDIDQYVRVSDDESRILRTKLSAKMGKDWNEFSRNLSSTNAHSILDKIRF